MAAGGIPRVVAAMTAHVGHSGVSASACGALRNLAFSGGTSPAGITHPTGWMRTAAGRAVRLLLTMPGAVRPCVDSDGAAEALSAGGVGRVLAAMAAHVTDVTVQRQGCAALAKLATSDGASP